MAQSASGTDLFPGRSIPDPHKGLAMARGVALGWSMPERKEEQRRASRKGAAKNAENACMHAANILPIIRQIAAGCASLRKIADELNDRGITTARGGLWYASTVRPD